ncbi:DUF6457 domain-containing protein [Kitasatospora sp. NPDC004240]
MKSWIAAVRNELGIDLDVDEQVTELLGMTRVVAHGVARPAAPLTAFLVGYAAARAGGGPAAVTAANRRVGELAERWTAEAAGRYEEAGPHEVAGQHEAAGRYEEAGTA